MKIHSTKPIRVSAKGVLVDIPEGVSTQSQQVATEALKYLCVNKVSPPKTKKVKSDEGTVPGEA